MGRGLDGYLFLTLLRPCAVFKLHRASRKIPVAHSERETPLPIPNRAVKPFSADGTWGATPWESRSPPVLLIAVRAGMGRGLRRSIRGAWRPVRPTCVALLRGAGRPERHACVSNPSPARRIPARTAGIRGIAEGVGLEARITDGRYGRRTRGAEGVEL